MDRRTALLACWLIACGGSAAGGSTARTQGVSDAGVEDDDDFKGCPADIPALAPGARAIGDHYALQLLAATPDQPERYLDNHWTVESAPLDGSSAADVQIVRGQTFMPIHGHDGRVEPEITSLDTPRHFQVERLNFSMRGPWEVRLWLHSATVDEDYLVFHVCVAK
jgi:hypothetical protein